MRRTKPKSRPQTERFTGRTSGALAVRVLTVCVGSVASAGGLGLAELAVFDGTGRTPDESDCGETDDEEGTGAVAGAGDCDGVVGRTDATASATSAKGKKVWNSETTLRL